MEHTIRFVLDGEVVSVPQCDPTRTVLQFLREDCQRLGTKEGCAEGDCGACTVVLASPNENGTRLRYQAVNSCIQFLPTLDGKELITVESLTGPEGELHPVQQAMVECHGSQCGFCTPGIVMSLFALYKNQSSVERSDIDQTLAGNLCRCTGYRPIIDAASKMYRLGQALPGPQRSRFTSAGTAAPCDHRPGSHVISEDKSRSDAGDKNSDRERLDAGNEENDRDHDKGVAGDGGNSAGEAAEQDAAVIRQLQALQRNATLHVAAGNQRYFAPVHLADLAMLVTQHPDATLLAGGTDVGLWVTKDHRELDIVIYVGGVKELTRIEQSATHLGIGAAATLSAVMPVLLTHYPDLGEMFTRFAAPPVRNAGTLGGNIANGSPIGDSMPALIALGAHVILRQGGSQRRLELEDLYRSYGVTAMEQGEFLESVQVPLPPPKQFFRCYKLSKRFDEDISAVCMAIAVTVERKRVVAIRIGCGGLSEVPARARDCEQALLGRPWTEASVRSAMAALDNEFTPISDMRASAGYRRIAMQNLLMRFYIENSDPKEDTRVYHFGR